MDEGSFRSSLIDIARNLNEFETKSLIFLVYETECGISSEKCQAPLDLVQLLKQSKVITPDNPAFLKSLLELICRRDLADKLACSASVSVTVPRSTIGIYKVMTALTDEEVKTLKFFYEVPQGQDINDAIDLAVYLRKKEKLSDIREGLLKIDRNDLLSVIDNYNSTSSGATATVNDESLKTSHPGLSELYLLLVGKTGVGKSSSGNRILGKRVFKSSPSTTGGTDEICSSWAKVKGRIITVVDGPGFGDPNLSKDEGIKFFRKAMRQAVIRNKRGYHALLLVLRYQPRLSLEDCETVKVLREVFGDDFIKKFCVVVVTHGDNFKRDAEEEKYYSNIHEWLCDQPGLNIMNDCCSRVVLFDNMTKNEDEISAQHDDLLGKISRLNNGGQRYTYENLKLV